MIHPITVYTVKEYQLKFHPEKCLRTVQMMVKRGLMQKNHVPYKAHDYFILVNNYYPACIEFHEKRDDAGDDVLLATVLSLKYEIEKHILFNYLGL